jgi:hypothetical protein
MVQQMMRRSLFTEDGLNYDPDCLFCEDYDLWDRAASLCKFANIGEVLVNYRWHPSQTSQHASPIVREYANRTRQKQLRRLNIIPTEEEFGVHQAISVGEVDPTPFALDCAESWLLKLDTANRETNTFPPQAFSKTLADYWYGICNLTVRKSGVWAVPRIFSFPLMSPDILGRRVINKILAQFQY